MGIPTTKKRLDRESIDEGSADSIEIEPRNTYCRRRYCLHQTHERHLHPKRNNQPNQQNQHTQHNVCWHRPIKSPFKPTCTDRTRARSIDTKDIKDPSSRFCGSVHTMPLKPVTAYRRHSTVARLLYKQSVLSKCPDEQRICFSVIGRDSPL